MRAANHTKGERLRKAKEDKRRKRQQKLQAREWGEDTDSDNDDDCWGPNTGVSNEVELIAIKC